jgi:ornithine cyclodeaminase/alanine dehydrogenase-like protein (mu-crystallin family)
MVVRRGSAQTEGVDGRQPPVPRYLSRSELHATLPFRDAIDALEQAFATARSRRDEHVPRTVTSISDGDDGDDGAAEILLMPAFGPEGTGVKIVTIARANPARGLPLIQGSYVLFSPDELSPELLIDAAALTSLRTASVSALATRHLARRDSRELVVFGAGAQAEAHVAAMLAVRPIERVTLVATSPSSPRARSLVERVSSDDIEIRIGGADAVSTADIVCTCTTSVTPVFDSRRLAPGAHVNAVGAYRPDMREIDLALLARAVVVVETLEAAAAEAGDLLAAITAGALPPKNFAHELADVVSGQAGRGSDEQVTVFKSVGLAVEDLVIARAVADRLSGPGRVEQS